MYVLAQDSPDADLEIVSGGVFASLDRGDRLLRDAALLGQLSLREAEDFPSGLDVATPDSLELVHRS